MGKLSRLLMYFVLFAGIGTITLGLADAVMSSMAGCVVNGLTFFQPPEATHFELPLGFLIAGSAAITLSLLASGFHRHRLNAGSRPTTMHATKKLQ
jgi:hypothetical protein